MTPSFFARTQSNVIQLQCMLMFIFWHNHNTHAQLFICIDMQNKINRSGLDLSKIILYLSRVHMKSKWRLVRVNGHLRVARGPSHFLSFILPLFVWLLLILICIRVICCWLSSGIVVCTRIYIDIGMCHTSAYTLYHHRFNKIYNDCGRTTGAVARSHSIVLKAFPQYMWINYWLILIIYESFHRCFLLCPLMYSFNNNVSWK